jgi:hypothetical protein
VGESGHRWELPTLDSVVDAVDTLLAIEDIDEMLNAGEIMPVRSPSSYDGVTFTSCSWRAMLEEKPARGNVLLRTIFLMLVRLNPELPVEAFEVLDGSDEFKAPSGDDRAPDQAGEFAFDGSW